MKHKLINYLLIAGALVFSASCAEEDWRGNGESAGDPIEIGEITVDEASQSRAHDNSDNWMWVPNEKIVVTATSKDNVPLGQATYRRSMANDAWVSDNPLPASVRQDGAVFTVSTAEPTDEEKKSQDDAYTYVLTDYVMATGADVSFDTSGKLTAALKHRTVDVVAVLTKGDGWDSDEAFYEALSGCSATFYAGNTYAIKGFAVSGNDDSVDYNDNAGEESIASGKKTHIFRAHIDAAQLAAAKDGGAELLQLAGLSGNSATGKYTRPTGVENGKRLTVTFHVDAPEVDVTRSAASGDSSLENGVAVVQDWLGTRALYGTDDVTSIATEADLKAFRDAVNDGNSYEGKTVTLTADITVTGWTEGIGIEASKKDDNKPFSGTFDGTGHVINLTGSASLFALVGKSDETYGTVQNLGVKAAITANADYTGGIVGHNYGTVQNCYSEGTVTNASYYTGGIAGGNHGIIQNCYSTASCTGNDIAGGIVGSNFNTILRCYATGAVSGESAGGIAGSFQGSNITINNCIALNTSVTATDEGNKGGRIINRAPSGCTFTGNYASPIIPGTWNEKGDGKKDGIDLTDDNFTNVTGATGAFANWPVGTDGWDLTTANLPTLKGFTADQPVKDITRANVMTKPLTIATAQELADFRDAVNNGETYEGREVTLTADITVTGWTEGIGSNGNHFLGTFDGGGYVITLTGSTGLFNTIKSGVTVQKLGVNATITTSSSTGGIAKYNHGTIRRCYTQGTITASNMYAGGIVAQNLDDGIIEDCYSTATVTVTKPTNGQVGGIAGQNDNGTIRRCYATGAVSATSTENPTGVAGIVGSNYSTVNNCIALNTSLTGGYTRGRVSIGGTLSDNYAAPFIPGTWNYKGAGKKDGADLTEDNFIDQETGATVIAFEDWPVAFWDFSTPANLPTLKVFKGNQPAQGITRKSVMSKPPIITITSAEDLAAFRTAVEEGATYEGKTVTLANDIAVTDWETGIGYSKSFLGIFDGQGHVINLTGTVSLFAKLGKSGGQGKGTVQNLGVKVALTVAGGDSYGGIVGWNYGTIKQCYTEGTIASSKQSSYAGSIAGKNFSVIQDCYSTASITVWAGAGGIAQINQSGATIQRCFATGAISVGPSSDGTGGVVGDNEGNITKCIALNEKITGGNLGRIACEKYGASFSGNYASLLISGSWSSQDAAAKDGENLTPDNFINVRDASGAFAGWATDNDDCWKLDTPNLPTLKVFQGKQSVGDITRQSAAFITIGSKDELKAFRDKVNGGESYNGKTILLTADIDLSGEDWTPIGNNSSHYFEGEFDGNYHVIRNMKVTVEGMYAGLFGNIEGWGSSVKHLGVTGKSSGTSKVGGIAGYLKNGSVSHCYTNVEVSASEGISGGIVGEGYNADISNCYSVGSVSAPVSVPAYDQSFKAGGIIGFGEYGGVRYCYATGAVTGEKAGGISARERFVSDCIALNVAGVKGTTGGEIAAVGISNGTDLYWSPLIPLEVTTSASNGTALDWQNYKSVVSNWPSASWNNVKNSAKLPTLKGFGTNQPAALLRWVSFLPDR